MYLKDLIEENGGVDGVLFIAPFRPVKTIMGISFTIGSDEEILLPASIDEKRYKVEKNYKVTLQCDITGFGNRHYYQSDLLLLLKKKQVFMYKRIDVN